MLLLGAGCGDDETVVPDSAEAGGETIDAADASDTSLGADSDSTPELPADDPSLRFALAGSIQDIETFPHGAGGGLDGVTPSHERPDDLILRLRPDARTAVVALTHDPKLDDLALMDALRSEAFYVGAIGSRRNTAQRRERLREHFDVPDAALDALHGPAGLYIGSKTPAEIALSIMAEVVAVKNGIHRPQPASVEEGKALREPLDPAG